MLADHRPRVHHPLIVELSSSETPDGEDSASRHEQREYAKHATQRALPELPGAHIAGETRAAMHAALAAQHAVPTPPATVFAAICVSPESPVDAADAQQYRAAAAAALRELATRLTALTPVDLDLGADPATSAVVHGGVSRAARSLDDQRRGLRPGVLIEEVTEEAPPEPEPQRLSAAEVVLLCGMHAQDDALAGAWVSADASAAARVVLECLASKQTSMVAGYGEASAHVEQCQGPGAGTQAAVRHGEIPAAVQQLIVRTLPAVLRLLRPVLGRPRELRLRGQTAAPMPPIRFGEGELIMLVQLGDALRGVSAASDARWCGARRGQSLQQALGGTAAGMACAQPSRRCVGVQPSAPAARGPGCCRRPLPCRAMPRCGALTIHEASLQASRLGSSATLHMLLRACCAARSHVTGRAWRLRCSLCVCGRRYKA